MRSVWRMANRKTVWIMVEERGEYVNYEIHIRGVYATRLLAADAVQRAEALQKKKNDTLYPFEFRIDEWTLVE